MSKHELREVNFVPRLFSNDFVLFALTGFVVCNTVLNSKPICYVCIDEPSDATQVGCRDGIASQRWAATSGCSGSASRRACPHWRDEQCVTLQQWAIRRAWETGKLQVLLLKSTHILTVYCLADVLWIFGLCHCLGYGADRTAAYRSWCPGQSSQVSSWSAAGIDLPSFIHVLTTLI